MSSTIGYQLLIDGRKFNNVPRRSWKEAARDAVTQGYGVWIDDGDAVRLDGQAEIVVVAHVFN